MERMTKKMTFRERTYRPESDHFRHIRVHGTPQDHEGPTAVLVKNLITFESQLIRDGYKTTWEPDYSCLYGGNEDTGQIVVAFQNSERFDKYLLSKDIQSAYRPHKEHQDDTLRALRKAERAFDKSPGYDTAAKLQVARKFHDEARRQGLTVLSNQ